MDLQQFGATLLSLLTSINQRLVDLYNKQSPTQAEDRIQKIYLTSQTGANAKQDLGGEAHIVALLIGDSATGRGTLNVDSESIPFYTSAYVSKFYRFGPNDLVFRGGQASWTPPNAGDTYDVVLFVRMR